MNARLASFAIALIVIAASGAHAGGLPAAATSGPAEIEQLLAQVPDGANWQDLAPDLQASFRSRAASLLEQDRQSWGLAGLQRKQEMLLTEPTPAMTENIDRVLSVTFAPELPDGFAMARDVESTELKRLLVRVYLAITDDRGFMLYNHPDFMGWDGMPVRELQLLDHEHVKAIATWLRLTEDGLRALPDDKLSALDKVLRDKSYFTTRAGKHFDRPAVGINGSMNFSNLYALPSEKRPFTNDAELLDAYSASMFAAFREVNVGTLDAFMYDYESEFNQPLLECQGMSSALAANIIKLGNLYRSRVQALPEKSLRCTILSSTGRDAHWDAFTASQITNADGSNSMRTYAERFRAIAAQRLLATQSLGHSMLERFFPDGSPELTTEQRKRVADRLTQEKRPAKLKDSLLAALDEATGGASASKKVNDAFDLQPKVGGNYSDGETVREADKTQIFAMWNKIRAFIKREYSGYRVDISALVPAQPIIVTKGQNQYTLGGQVTLSLGTEWNLASLSSTMMHEIKHAIDQNSHAAVEGAAWEGAATSIERQVWPIFIEEAMAEQGALLPAARLKTEIDNVRFTATTDATLKIFLRESCLNDEPDTIAYAENIVREYGYDDEETLHLRSRRAHRSWQYLEYDYGLAMYTDVLDYLQQDLGVKPRVDAYLLQACALPSAKKEKATIERLKACIRDRKS
ncbi:hypothetical protein [Bradyrhizobium diazoefficiens]|uniref:hypothetical protein n=1 Tax=Bradyrhizobium diazoefficiens TaxID=1355477 RepID=UPI0004B5D32B|nr:hypothetical protein [Bradyrhizobium diazoefficiens]